MSRETPRRPDADPAPLGPTFEPVDEPLPTRARERRQLGFLGATVVVLLGIGVLLTILYLATSPPVDIPRPQPPAFSSDDDDAPAPADVQWPRLVPGDSGRPVRAAQLLLRASGQELPITGTYGSATGAALNRFVAQRELDTRTLDGTVWPFLAQPLGPRSEGARVRAMQVLLRGNGFDVATDGQFGGAVRGAIRLFQVQSGLPGSGIAGRPTWKLLAVSAEPFDAPRIGR
ncbi:peptidoglycan-binding protein [Nocardioidaceae bacterium]|nr:peptidoglycan-binding protein [Nocardioidaceae bacterium]